MSTLVLMAPGPARTGASMQGPAQHLPRTPTALGPFHRRLHLPVRGVRLLPGAVLARAGLRWMVTCPNVGVVCAPGLMWKQLRPAD